MGEKGTGEGVWKDVRDTEGMREGVRDMEVLREEVLFKEDVGGGQANAIRYLQ